MKKNIIKLASLVLILIVGIILSGCKKENDFSPTRKVSVIMPSGTPVLALGGLFGEENDLEVVTDTTLLQTALITKSVDIVIAPLTMGTNLFLKGKSTYKLEAIVTTNNTYLISNSSIAPVDLQGKTIVGFNENNTPGIILKMYLEQNSIECTTQFEANVNASVNAFTQGNAEYAVVAEPQLTKLRKQFPNLNYLNLATTLTEEFIPQAAIYVNSETASDENVIHFLNEIRDNIYYMNTNPNEYVDSIMGRHPYFETLGAEILKESIPTTNVSYHKASEHKDIINEFYTNIDKYANNMFGGVVPGENFYN